MKKLLSLSAVMALLFTSVAVRAAEAKRDRKAAAPAPKAPALTPPLGLPGAEALPKDIPDFLVKLVDQFLDELFEDPSVQELFHVLVKEIVKAELLRVEALPKDPEKAERVATFVDEFVEGLLADRKLRALFMAQLRELLRVQILIELMKDPNIQRMLGGPETTL